MSENINKNIIDIHVHTFPEKIAASAVKILQSKSHTKNFSDGTQEGLISSMKDSGVKYSIVLPVATKPEQVINVNNSSIKINNSGYETGIFSFGAIHPNFENYYSELKRIFESGIKGIKIHPVYQGVNIDDERYLKILERAGELGLITLIHAGWDVGFPGEEYDQAIPEKIFKALKLTGNFKIILAHMGGWRSWDKAQELFSGTGVYIDTSFSLGYMESNGDGFLKTPEDLALLTPEEFLKIIKNFGSDYVLFGTDSPWSSQSDYVNKINSLPLEESEKEKIFFKNYMELLKI